MPTPTLALAISAIFLAVPAPNAVQVTIAGTVVDSKGNGLMGVEVSLVPTGTGDAMKSTRTGPGGTYKFQNVAITSHYDIIYSHSKYDLAVVKILSEAKGQDIHKVLYEKGAPRPAVAALDFLQSAETVMVLSLTRPDEGPIKNAIKNQALNEGLIFLLNKDVQLQGSPPTEVRTYIEGRRRALAVRAAKVFDPKPK